MAVEELRQEPQAQNRGRVGIWDLPARVDDEALEAAELYSRALALDPKGHTLHANRSACRAGRTANG